MERLTDLTLWRLQATCACRGQVVITLGPGDAEPRGPIACPVCGRVARRLYILVDTTGWPPITEAELAALARADEGESASGNEMLGVR